MSNTDYKINVVVTNRDDELSPEHKFDNVSEKHWDSFDETLSLLIDDDIPIFIELVWEGQIDLFWEGLEQAESEHRESNRQVRKTTKLLPFLRPSCIKFDINTLNLHITVEEVNKDKVLMEMKTKEFNVFTAIMFNSK